MIKQAIILDEPYIPENSQNVLMCVDTCNFTFSSNPSAKFVSLMYMNIPG